MRYVVLGGLALFAFGAGEIRAGSYWELESARANARAGGPISDRDAELLERYGCLSGTESAFCKKLSGSEPPKKARKRMEWKSRD